jgi:uncharacterized protein (TIGR02270 family)
MSSSLRAFQIGLYSEHLEEASFLYEQRRTLLRDPEIGWPRLRDFESRLEAHLDALMVGESTALELCRERLATEDAGELFAIVCIVCRHQQASMLNDLWRRLDFKDGRKVVAVVDALKFEIPVSWASFCERAISRGAHDVLPILAEVCGYRRIPLGEQIASALLATPQHQHARAVWALSRMNESEATFKALAAGLENPHPGVRAAAVLGLMRKNRWVAIQACQHWSADESWPQLYLALSGVRATVAELRARIEAGLANSTTLQALGILGDLSAVRPLCTCLEDEALAESASQALYWITGARLYEESFVEEPIREDELFDAEKRELLATGRKPVRSDGKPFGTTIVRLSHDRVEWEAWLALHAKDFDSNVRYRFGRPHSPRAVLRGLVDERIPYASRQWCYEELGIRYACPVNFEADWRVDDQFRALRSIDSWAQENAERLGAGQWR